MATMDCPIIDCLKHISTGPIGTSTAVRLEIRRGQFLYMQEIVFFCRKMKMKNNGSWTR
jgi:hypothetical protein